MAILIDGYNLLHASGIFGPPDARRPFQRSREELIRFLAERLGDRAASTQIVFDASEAPPGLPRRASLFGISIHFAADHESADQLLEELIQSNHAPRRLTVVSSDHRVQRAARRRRATAVDSHVWFAELLVARRNHGDDAKNPATKPEQELGPAAIAYWLRELNLHNPGTTDPVEPLPWSNPFPDNYMQEATDFAAHDPPCETPHSAHRNRNRPPGTSRPSQDSVRNPGNP
jgi:predicted RNA-binding protein with PIN domain